MKRCRLTSFLYCYSLDDTALNAIMFIDLIFFFVVFVVAALYIKAFTSMLKQGSISDEEVRKAVFLLSAYAAAVVFGIFRLTIGICLGCSKSKVSVMKWYFGIAAAADILYVLAILLKLFLEKVTAKSAFIFFISVALISVLYFPHRILALYSYWERLECPDIAILESLQSKVKKIVHDMRLSVIPETQEADNISLHPQ